MFDMEGCTFLDFEQRRVQVFLLDLRDKNKKDIFIKIIPRET